MNQTLKREDVQLALSEELTYIELSRDLGANDKTLCNWIRQTMDKPKPLVCKDQAPNKQDYQSLERHNKTL